MCRADDDGARRVAAERRGERSHAGAMGTRKLLRWGLFDRVRRRAQVGVEGFPIVIREHTEVVVESQALRLERRPKTDQMVLGSLELRELFE